MTSPPGRQLAPQLRNVILTKRERKVMILISYGKTNKSIAKAIGTTENTVKTYITKLLRMLNAIDRAHLVRIGIQCGIVPLDSPEFRAVITEGRRDRSSGVIRMLLLQPAKAWSANEVAGALCWRRDAARGGLEKAVGAGWVKRVPHFENGKRRVSYRLTEEGQRKARQLTRVATQASVERASTLRRHDGTSP